MFLFAQLNHKLSKYMPRDKIDAIAKTFLFAADAHESQLRSSGEPYLIHPLSVAEILADLHMDKESIIAAILHDILEDTKISYEEMCNLFGQKVTKLVDGVTKLSRIASRSKAELQAESMRKMMLAMVEDIRVIIIKLADRLHNMRTIDSLPPHKRKRIAQETIDIYAPIANRLGMHHIMTELQDLGFRAMYPLRYRILEGRVTKARGNRRRLLEKIAKPLISRLANDGVPAKNISGREKRIFSIYRKMHDKGLHFSEIMDMYGFRIIANDTKHCYTILGTIHNIFTPIPGQFKDYIAIPKANGYQSLHTKLFGPYGVPIEIQIRTLEMDENAEHGVAAHWLYKNQETKEITNLKAREWLKRLIDLQQKSKDSMDFIENVKIDLYPDDVYVFTPRGDILELPKGATGVDFAYYVHTDIGNHCKAIKVNKQLVHLSHILKNGQTVQVLTSQAASPKPSWLNFVVSSKAKTAIKHYLKTQKQDDSVILGKKLLAYSLAEFNLSWDRIGEKIKVMLLKNLRVRNINALFELIGKGERSSAVVTYQILDIIGGDEENLRRKTHSNNTITIDGAEGINTKFATCCHPIPGDEVQGLLVKGRGLEIHRSDCPVLNKKSTKSDATIQINVNWAANITNQMFMVKLKIESNNKLGSIAAITNAIAKNGSNIKELHTGGDDQDYSILSAVIEVADKKHLLLITKSLGKLKCVVRVSRI